MWGVKRDVQEAHSPVITKYIIGSLWLPLHLHISSYLHVSVTGAYIYQLLLIAVVTIVHILLLEKPPSSEKQSV